MSSNNIRSDNSAFMPYERKKSVDVSTEFHDIDQPRPQEQHKMTKSINAARQNRKMIFNNIRNLFKDNVSRVLPFLKEHEYNK